MPAFKQKCLTAGNNCVVDLSYVLMRVHPPSPLKKTHKGLFFTYVAHQAKEQIVGVLPGLDDNPFENDIVDHANLHLTGN